jgi:hypothetical protein
MKTWLAIVILQTGELLRIADLFAMTAAALDYGDAAVFLQRKISLTFLLGLNHVS